MLGRGIASITFPTVARIIFGKFIHMLVAGHLGYDGGGGDGEAEAISPHKAAVFTAQSRILKAIYEGTIGNHAEAGDRPAHGQQAGLQDVELIHFGGGTAGHRSDRVIFDGRGQLYPARMRQNLGVIKSFAQPGRQAR